jgi:hypothetical protein
MFSIKRLVLPVVGSARQASRATRKSYKGKELDVERVELLEEPDSL